MEFDGGAMHVDLSEKEFYPVELPKAEIPAEAIWEAIESQSELLELKAEVALDAGDDDEAWSEMLNGLARLRRYIAIYGGQK